MLQQFESEPDVYFQYNVDAGLENIGLQEWKRLSEVLSVITDYMSGFEVKKRIGAVVGALRRSFKAEGESLDPVLLSSRTLSLGITSRKRFIFALSPISIVSEQVG